MFDKADCPVEITVGMPVFNAATTIARSLVSLTLQNIPLKVVIIDNGSTDGTYEMLQVVAKNNVYGYTVQLERSSKQPGGKDKNIPIIRRKICDILDTDYLFFLDADVSIPSLILQDLLVEMKKRPVLGALGLAYEPHAPHVKMGAVLIRRELAKEINWKWDDEGCDCMYFAFQAAARQYEVEHFKGTCARHLRYDLH